MSTFSDGASASDLAGPWVKSSYSGPQGNCVEVAPMRSGGVAVRNSRYPDGPALVFSAAEWDAFLAGAVAGEFGLPA